MFSKKINIATQAMSNFKNKFAKDKSADAFTKTVVCLSISSKDSTDEFLLNKGSIKI